MTRTLSVAGTLAVLVFALWFQRTAVGLPSLGADTAAPSATVQIAAAADEATDPVQATVDALAAWPAAAGR